jgi:hypothetical protein
MGRATADDYSHSIATANSDAGVWLAGLVLGGIA